MTAVSCRLNRCWALQRADASGLSGTQSQRGCLFARSVRRCVYNGKSSTCSVRIYSSLLQDNQDKLILYSLRRFLTGCKQIILVITSLLKKQTAIKGVKGEFTGSGWRQQPAACLLAVFVWETVVWRGSRTQLKENLFWWNSAVWGRLWARSLHKTSSNPEPRSVSGRDRA